MQPFRRILSSPLFLITLLEGLIATACYIAAVYVTRPIDASIYLEYEGGLQHIALLSAFLLLTGYLSDFYKHVRVRSHLVLVLELLYLIGIIFLAHAALAFINPDLVATADIVIFGNAFVLVLLIPWRLFVRPALWAVIGRQRVLFVGGGAAVQRLAEAYREDPALGVQVCGCVRDSSFEDGTAIPVIGSSSDLTEVVSKFRPGRIIASVDELRNNRVLKTLFDLRSTGLAVESAADAYETLFGRMYLPAVDPFNVIFRNDLSARPGSVALQSIYTNLLALAAIIVTVPVMVLIAVALKITGNHRVLAEHICVGLYGLTFSQYRFDCSGSGRLRKLLTKYRLEAIPQIINILRGDMALIGPRAERVEFDRVIGSIIPFWRQKQAVKPGILGWSQLHCDIRSTEDTLDRLEYDLYYIKHISLVLDAYILLRGLKWILSDRTPGREQARA